jgi:hypothetical protein
MDGILIKEPLSICETQCIFCTGNLKTASLSYLLIKLFLSVAYPGIFFRGGVQQKQIQLRTEGGDNGDLAAVAP